MLCWLLRHRLRNNTNRTLYLRELSAHGLPVHETRLDPNSMIDNFPAAKYQNDGRLLGCPSMIAIFVDKDQAFGGLIPQDFIKYFELIFEIDEGSNTLIVSGIPAQLTDYFPFRYIPLVRTLKHLPYKERPDYLWKYLTKRGSGKPGNDYSGRLRDIVMISGFKAVKAKNKGHLPSGQEMTTIYVMINYDGERKKNEEGGYIWSSGAHAKWEAISVYKNNLTLDGVANEICSTLGLNGLETKLLFSHLPESYIPHPHYIQDSRMLETYLTLFPYFYETIPQLHVKTVKTNDDQVCGEKKYHQGC